ncbi:MAG: tyrosine-type recombinase/integrase, partial [Anaerolineales bacterium]|nr:tyrosine-type recombinase/integrase [Anaerolineales bacterium]
MNHSSSGLSASKTLVGFLNTKAAEGLSPRTLQNYEHRLKQWIDYAGDVAVAEVTPQIIRRYLTWLRTEYKPKRFNGDDQPLSPKTIRNVYVTLLSFFTWASTEFDIDSPMESVPAPKFQSAPVIPLSRDDVDAMLDVCDLTRRANTTDRSRFQSKRATARRDRAIILTLLDTGLRASELCALRIGDVDLKTGRVEVRHGPRGGAKGGKGRTVFLGKTARRFLWRYLAEREDEEDPEAPVFISRWDRPMNPNSLRQLIKSLAEKAGVRDCYPHRFRHTFAITYLRAGGDVFTLQALLGHSSLEMVRHYSRIAEVDLANA